MPPATWATMPREWVAHHMNREAHKSELILRTYTLPRPRSCHQRWAVCSSREAGEEVDVVGEEESQTVASHLWSVFEQTVASKVRLRIQVTVAYPVPRAQGRRLPRSTPIGRTLYLFIYSLIDGLRCWHLLTRACPFFRSPTLCRWSSLPPLTATPRSCPTMSSPSLGESLALRGHLLQERLPLTPSSRARRLQKRLLCPALVTMAYQRHQRMARNLLLAAIGRGGGLQRQRGHHSRDRVRRLPWCRWRQARDIGRSRPTLLLPPLPRRPVVSSRDRRRI